MPGKSGSKSNRGPTKSQLAGEIADETGLSRADVNRVLESLASVTVKHLRQDQPVTFPGLVKLRVRRKPASKARKMFSHLAGKEITVAAKPAHNVVRASAIKALKDAI